MICLLCACAQQGKRRVVAAARENDARSACACVREEAVKDSEVSKSKCLSAECMFAISHAQRLPMRRRVWCRGVK